MDSAGTYKRRGNLGGARHGDNYQVHVVMLVGGRAVSGKDKYENYGGNFQLALEMEAAGNFDDVVFRWQNKNDQWQWLLIQVKYKKTPVNLYENHLFPCSESEKSGGEYSLQKYLASYWGIKSKNELVGEKQFVIYTNCGFAESIQDWFTDADVECILKTGTENERFMKMIPRDEHYTKLYDNQDLKDLAKIVRSTLINKEKTINLNLVRKYRGAITRRILVTTNKSVKFAPRFINNKKLDDHEKALRNELFPENVTSEQLSSYCAENEELSTVLLSNEKSINVLPPLIAYDEVKEFLDCLIFAINQPDNIDLKNVIMDELNMQQSFAEQSASSDNPYATLGYYTLKNRIHDLLDSPADRCEPLCKSKLEKELKTVSSTISKSRLNLLENLSREKMHSFRVEYKYPASTVPQTYPAAVITSTRKGMLLNSLKVFQALKGHDLRYFSLKDLENYSIRKELFEALSEPAPSFHLLLQNDCVKFSFAAQILEAVASKSSVRLILLTYCEKSASNFFKENHYSTVNERDITLDQLTEPSQQMLMSKSVLFQGIEVPLSQLADPEVLGRVIKNDTLEKLLLDESVSIGPALPELVLKRYIPRVISTSDNDDLNNESSNYSEQDFLDKAPTLSGESKVVLLSSITGMGKTSLWKQLANLTKFSFNTNWVFYINLQDCVTYLRAGEEADGRDILKRLFNLSDLDRSFVQYSYKLGKNMYIFCDAYDELPFESMEPAIVFIRKLQEFAQVFVSTRTQHRKELEQAFQVDAFFLKPFSESQKEDIFRSFFDEDVSNSALLSIFINRLMAKIQGGSMKIASTIVGIPLMIEMMAEIYKTKIEEYLRTMDPGVLIKIDREALDIGQLYDKFVFILFQREHIEKLNLSMDNHHTQRMLDANNILYTDFIQVHSFQGLKSLVGNRCMVSIVPDRKIFQQLEKRAELLISPLVTGFTGFTGLPRFIHRSIAEFFAAKFLFHNFIGMDDEELQREFMKDDREFHRIPPNTMLELYFQVFDTNPTVRNFFFGFAWHHISSVPVLAENYRTAEFHIKFLQYRTELQLWKRPIDKLQKLLRSMRPFSLTWAREHYFQALGDPLAEELGLDTAELEGSVSWLSKNPGIRDLFFENPGKSRDPGIFLPIHI